MELVKLWQFSDNNALNWIMMLPKNSSKRSINILHLFSLVELVLPGIF
jgi:hypothetical protein